MTPSLATVHLHSPSPETGMRDAIEDVLSALGENIHREGLLDTPARVARSLTALTAGYKQEVEEVVGDALFDEDSDRPVLVRDIEFYSLCEHHMLPFFGVAHVAYLPAGRVIGLSKIPRILDVYARRLQVQERITWQVAEAIDSVLHSRGVAVMLEASHFCMMMRGVQKQQSRTTTIEYRGAYRNEPARQSEFLILLRSLGR